MTNIINGIGGSVSPYVMGGFIERNDINLVWPVIFLLAMVSALFMLVLGTCEKRNNPA